MLLPQAHLHVHAAGPQPPDTDFVLDVETTGAGETFQLGCLDIGTYNGVVKWGDGQQDTITAYNDPALIHTYAIPGIHEVRCSGTWPTIHAKSGDELKWREIKNWGDTNTENFYEICMGASNVRLTATDGPNLDGVSVAVSAFQNASNLGPADFNAWDVSSVTNAANMFFAAKGNFFLSSWNVANFTTFSQLFKWTVINEDLSAWYWPNVTNTYETFQFCSQMSTENADNFLWSIYNMRNDVIWHSPSIDISSFNDPSGVYQDPQGIPTSGKEIIYVLENDPDGEGFKTWSITY